MRKPKGKVYELFFNLISSTEKISTEVFTVTDLEWADALAAREKQTTGYDHHNKERDDLDSLEDLEIVGGQLVTTPRNKTKRLLLYRQRS